MMLVCGRCTARRGETLAGLRLVWYGPCAVHWQIRQESAYYLSQLSRTVYRVPGPPFEGPTFSLTLIAISIGVKVGQSGQTHTGIWL